MPQVHQFDDLPEETKEFLSELREEEIDTLVDGIRLVRSIHTVGKVVKWLLVGLLGIAVGTAMFIEAIQKVLAWLKSMAPG